MLLTESIPSGWSTGRSTGTLVDAYLDIRLDGGAPMRRRLAESHLVIGRNPGLELQLEHHTVSRLHAEMFCDPFGRWWIRDLGSTNGTAVDDEAVQERVLSPGDRITLGDYELTFHVEGELVAPESSELLPYDDEKPTVLRNIADLDPPRLAAGHLRTLLQFSRRLLEINDPDARMNALCELIIGDDFCGTLALVIRLRGRRFSELSRPHRPGQRVVAEGRPHISRRVIDMLRETRQPVLATNVTNHVGDSTVEISMARDMMELWVIACPFNIEAETMDVLYAQIPRDCGSAEWVSLYALAVEVYHQSEETWTARRTDEEHRAITRELDTARQIQQGLLPRKLVAPGLDIAVGFEPCKWIGGDYVDVVHMPDGRVLLVVADVCGKGLQAALVCSSLHTMVRATSDSNPTLSDLIERVNHHLCGWLPEHSFVTMVAVMIDPMTGMLECINAGHPPVFIIDRRGALRLLQTAENPALGIAPIPMDAEPGRLEAGEVLAMYTDGLTELRNAQREMLGEERLGAEVARLVASFRPKGAAAISAGLAAFLDSFRGCELPEDDRTFLIAYRITSASGARAVVNML